MSEDFSAIPILDYSLATNPETNGEFKTQLRHALINVGFLYLANPPVSRTDTDAVIRYAPQLFTLPEAAKRKIAMVNSPHFLGYSRLGSELTKGAVDQREQYDFATEHENRWVEGDPDFMRLWGPAQWPDEEAIPGFKSTFLRYLAQVEVLSNDFIGLVAEAFGLPAKAMDVFFEEHKQGYMQHRAKVVKYPTLDDVSSDQGVGPHFDSGFLTFLLQASSHAGLQVQNISGQWIDVPPIDGTLVVNLGKGLETVTNGLARATSHRVLSPPKGSSPRYSVPFFQNIGQRIRLSEIRLEFPTEIVALRRDDVGATDSVNYTEYDKEYSGQVALIGRIKSHPEVAERHYPELFKGYFPDGI